jgi:starch synthase
MISLRYGTVPVVRRTGGLADTITEYDPKTTRGNGFLFEMYDAWELLDAIKRAIALFKQKGLWAKLVSNAMKCDCSWDKSAERYLKVYKKLVLR